MHGQSDDGADPPVLIVGGGPVGLTARWPEFPSSDMTLQRALAAITSRA